VSQGRVLSALVANRPGVLNRVSGMIRRRGFNIESLTVGPTLDHRVSRMTLLVNVGAAPAEQAAEQLRKLVDVIDARDITQEPRAECELMLIRIAEADQQISQLREQAGPSARLIVREPGVVILAAMGPSEELDDLLASRLSAFRVTEIVRTGTAAMMVDPTHPHAVAHHEPAAGSTEDTEVMSIL
jgi:acetolactate synthase I/III small subunit